MNKDNLGNLIKLAGALMAIVICVMIWITSCANEKQRAAGKVRAAAYGEEGNISITTEAAEAAKKMPSPPPEPPDPNLLSLKDRLKIPLVKVALKYERFNVDQAVLSYRLTEKQEQLQRKGFANREATAKKLLDLKERFEAETGLLVEEAAALFPQVPARAGKK